MTRREWGLAGTVLAVATAFVFRAWLFAGRALYWGDTGLYFTPMMRFLRDELRAGTFPLWNPFILGGTPFVGNPQVWPLYPGTLLLPFMPASAFLTVSCVGHAFLAGLFFFLFLRRGSAGLSLWPALLGGVAYMFGGYLVGKAQYPNMLQALAFVPLVLWLAERLALRPRLSAALALGLALGLQLLAAHAQVTAYTLYLALCYGLFRWATAPVRPRFLPVLGGSLVAVTVALALSCGQWLPTLAARQSAARQALPLENVNRLHLSVSELSNFALPLRFGSPLRGDYIGPGAFWETACYAGTITLALALYGLMRGVWASDRRPALFWLGVFIVGMWLALGLAGGLFRVVYAVVPGMKLFHDPARFLLGPAVALSVLSATGLQAILDGLQLRGWGRRSLWLGGLVVGLTVLDLAAFVGSIYPLKPVAEIENQATLAPVASAMRSDAALTSGAGRVLTIDDVNADSALVSWTDFGQGDPRGLERLSNAMLPNSAMSVGLRDAGGYEPLALRDAGALSRLAIDLTRSRGRDQPDRPELASGVAPLLGMMGVRAVVTYRPQPLRPTPGLTPLMSWRDGPNTGSVYRNDAYVPRARLYTGWQRLAGREAAGIRPSDPVASALRAGGGPAIWRQVWLDQVWAGSEGPPPQGGPSFPVPAAIGEDQPDWVRVALPADPEAHLLVLADTFFPGWSATLDGRPVPVLKANGTYRAVYAPPSARARQLDFRFRPEPFVLGFYVMGVTITFLVSYGTFRLRRRQA